MKKLIASFLILMTITTMAQATIPDYTIPDFSTHEGMEKALKEALFIEGVTTDVKYSEKIKSFVVTMTKESLEYFDWIGDLADLEKGSIWENFIISLKMTQQTISVPFPDASIVFVLGRTENELFWVIAQWAGIVFIFDNTTGQIVYTEPSSKLQSINDLF